MRRLLTVLALIALAAPLSAGPKEEAEAALAIAAAKRTPVASAQVARLTFEAAVAKANKDGKPVLIRVNGFNCKDTCVLCAAQCTLCDKPQANEDKTPRLILAFPKEGHLHLWREWRTVPDEATVKAELLKLAEMKAREVRRVIQANDLR